MKTLANMAGYQLVWFCAVAGAGRGWWWAGPLAMLVFAAVYLSLREGWRDAALLIAVGLGGACVDSLLAATGLLRYAAAEPSRELAPVWIVAIWMSFALTLRHSWRFAHRRLALAALIAALGAPLAYLAAARGWQAVEFPHGKAFASLMLGMIWAVAMPLMLCLARRVDNARVAPRANGDDLHAL